MGKLLSNEDKGIITAPELGNRIRDLRCWRGYANRTDFSEIVGINRGTIAGYEHGKNAPSYIGLVKLSDALEVSVDQLLALETVPGFDKSSTDEVDARRSTLNDCYVSNPENARILDTVVCCLNDKHDTEKAMDALAAVMDVARPCLSHDEDRTG